MPNELDMEFDNLLETGYDALYGDWQKVAKQWMLKAWAVEKGYSFPLESRDQVIACLESLDCAGKYLVPGNRFKKNLDKYGHGTHEGWREKHWGSRDNAVGVKIVASENPIIFWFIIDKYPARAMKGMSLKYPCINFQVYYADEHKRSGRKLVLHRGTETEKDKISGEEIANIIRDYESSSVEKSIR